MIDQREIAQRLAVLKHVSDVVKAEEARLKDLALKAFDPKDRKSAVIDGRDIGTVSCTDGGKEQLKVVNQGAFNRWVKEHRPELVVTVESVPPAAVDRILAEVTQTGVMPDGVDIEVTKSQIRVSVTPSQKAAFEYLRATGAILPGGGVPGLPK